GRNQATIANRAQCSSATLARLGAGGHAGATELRRNCKENPMSFDEIDLERIEAERKREKELKKLKDEYGSEDRRWRPLRAEIPSEIAAQLDDFRRCNARTMMGQCQWAAIRNENFCPEHSS